jgi:transcription-repair coupling factor (superfamily II helicase)
MFWWLPLLKAVRSNANTIFINNANNFGLSDLHQMRGRVGRSNKKAFCYFICPPYSAMTDDARREFRHWNNLVI